MPGVYDALSAQIATKTGFEVIFISGYSLAATMLGEPDFGILNPNGNVVGSSANLFGDRFAGDRRCRHRLRQRDQRY